MKKLHHYVFGFIAGSFLLAAQSQAGIFLLEVPNYPTANKDCAQKVQALASSLSAAANVKINRAYCSLAEDVNFTNLNVVYESLQAVKSLDSLNRGGFESGLRSGIYKKLEICQSELANQQAEFESQTRSIALMAFCTRDRYMSSHSYYPVIVSLATDSEPRPDLMFKAFLIFGRRPADSDIVTQAFADKLRAEGVQIRSVVFADTPADSLLQLSYYGTESLKFDLKHEIYFENDAVCRARAETIANIFAQVGSKLYASFCSPDEYLHAVKFYTVAGVANKVVWKVVPGLYPTRKDCEDDQQHVEEVYRAQGVAVAGSACTYDKSYKVVILSGS